MSDTNAPEPTMEEILASIRRIISEDDAPATAAGEATATPADPPQPEVSAAAAEPETHADVLELTDRVEPEPSREPERQPEPEPVRAASPEPPASKPSASMGDLDFSAPPAPAAAAPPTRASSYEPPASLSSLVSDEPLVSHHAAGRASDMFGALTSSLAMPASGRTLEDVVRELLKPMLKDWLDQHLPAIVEQRVQDEVERISRRRTY